MIISMIIYNNKRLLLLLWMMNINKHFEHYHYPQSSNILWSFSFFLVTFDDSFNMWKFFFGLFGWLVGWVCFIISSEIYIFWFVYKQQMANIFFAARFFCCSGLVEICLLFHKKKISPVKLCVVYAQNIHSVQFQYTNICINKKKDHFQKHKLCWCRCWWCLPKITTTTTLTHVKR